MVDTVTHNQPRTNFSRLPDLLDRLVQQGGTLAVPSERVAGGEITSNLLETWESYWLQVSLPGADPETLDIHVVARHLTVKGKYHIPAIEAATYLRQEVAIGEFSEVFTMPGEVDGDKAEARYDRGVLTIRMPKVAYLKPKSITVQIGT